MYFDLVFLIVTIINTWYLKIFSQNIPIAVILFITTLVLYLIIFKNKHSHLFLIAFNLLFVILLFLQIKTTITISTFEISSLEKDFQQTRMNEYPPQLARLSYWIDGKKESVIFFKLLNNFFEPLDFTQYFFQKRFSAIYLPFFLIGLFELIKTKKKLLLLPILASITIITIIGNSSLFDMFCLYPVIVVSILSGFKFLLSYGKKYQN